MNQIQTSPEKQTHLHDNKRREENTSCSRAFMFGVCFCTPLVSLTALVCSSGANVSLDRSWTFSPQQLSFYSFQTLVLIRAKKTRFCDHQRKTGELTCCRNKCSLTSQHVFQMNDTTATQSACSSCFRPHPF